MSPGAQYVLAAHAVIVFAVIMYAVVVAMRRARQAREAELVARLEARAAQERADERARRREPSLESADA